MASFSALLVKHLTSRSYARRGRVVVVHMALSMALLGCAGPGIDKDAISNLPPLRVDDTILTVSDAQSRVPHYELLALDEPMKEFVARYTAGQGNTRLRLMSLHDAVRGAGALGLQYDPFAEGTAREAFHRGSANCLSYANLFIALAREAGLEASYQWVEVRPQWSRVSERIQVGLHVNVVLRLRGGKRFMVDIDPLPSHNMSGSQELTDSQGAALYYNNIAIAALGNDEVETAWLHLVRALQLNPTNEHLWANLGAVYRASGQHREAEQSYLQALELDFGDHSAMTNLAVLYDLQGRDEERNYWLGKVAIQRRSNPYYHAWLGDEAAGEESWQEARSHYVHAVEIAPYDSQLNFSLGIIFYQLDQYEAAIDSIEQAIELATLRSDISDYQRQLEAVRKAQVAGL